MSTSTHQFCQEGFQIQGVFLGVLKREFATVSYQLERRLIEFVFLGISLCILFSAFVVNLSFLSVVVGE